MATLENLNQFTRDLTGVYDKDVLPDPLVYRFLNQAYVETCTYRPWTFMERTDYLVLPAGSHILATDHGVYKVQELVVSNQDSSILVPAKVVQSTLVFRSEPVALIPEAKLFYDVQEDAVELWPALNVESVVRLRYQQKPEVLAPGDEPVFRSDFHDMLAYRAAGKLLTVQADETNRAQFWAEEFVAYRERMEVLYEELGEEGPIMIGGGNGYC